MIIGHCPEKEKPRMKRVMHLRNPVGIVLVVDEYRALARQERREPPVAADCHGPTTLEVHVERVRSQARQAHG